MKNFPLSFQLSIVFNIERKNNHIASFFVEAIQVNKQGLKVPDEGPLGLFTLRTCEKHPLSLQL